MACLFLFLCLHPFQKSGDPALNRNAGVTFAPMPLPRVNAHQQLFHAHNLGASRLQDLRSVIIKLEIKLHSNGEYQTLHYAFKTTALRSVLPSKILCSRANLLFVNILTWHAVSDMECRLLLCSFKLQHKHHNTHIVLCVHAHSTWKTC